MLRGKEAEEKCPKGTEYKGLAWYSQEIQRSFDKLKEFGLQGRSEVLKRLVYSRKQMDKNFEISVTSQNRAKSFNCERVEDEGMPPISQWRVIIDSMTLQGHCYGGRETSKIISGGGVSTELLMDNWFGCRW